MAQASLSKEVIYQHMTADQHADNSGSRRVFRGSVNLPILITLTLSALIELKKTNMAETQMCSSFSCRRNARRWLGGILHACERSVVRGAACYGARAGLNAAHRSGSQPPLSGMKRREWGVYLGLFPVMCLCASGWITSVFGNIWT